MTTSGRMVFAQKWKWR